MVLPPAGGGEIVREQHPYDFPNPALPEWDESHHGPHWEIRWPKPPGWKGKKGPKDKFLPGDPLPDNFPFLIIGP